MVCCSVGEPQRRCSASRACGKRGKATAVSLDGRPDCLGQFHDGRVDMYRSLEQRVFLCADLRGFARLRLLGVFYFSHGPWIA
jgi:hypothetical protein